MPNGHTLPPGVSLPDLSGVELPPTPNPEGVVDLSLLHELVWDHRPHITPEIHLPTRWIYVLSGGGARGAFEVGALLYLAASGRPEPAGICGTSVGAINTLALGEGFESGIPKLKGVWLSLLEGRDMLEWEPWVHDLRRRGVPIHDLLTGRHDRIGIVDYLATLYTYSTTSAIEEAGSSALAIYNLEPIRRRLAENVDTTALQRASKALRLVFVDLEAGYRHFVTESGEVITLTAQGRTRESLPYPTLQEALIHGAIASAAIPVAFRPESMERSNGTRWTCVDGGVRDVLPMRAAFDLIDNDELPGIGSDIGIVALSAAPVGMMNRRRLIGGSFGEEGFSPATRRENILTIGLRSVSIAVDEVHLDEVHPLGQTPANVQVVHIGPSFNVGPTDGIDPGLIQISMAYGYMTAFDEYARIDRGLSDDDYERLWWNTNFIAQARRWAWDLENLVQFVPGPVWEPGLVVQIRNAKRIIFEFVTDRISRYGTDSLPEEISNPDVGNINVFTDWWNQWERHTPRTTHPDLDPYAAADDPFARPSTPWDLLAGPRRGVSTPAESPPS